MKKCRRIACLMLVLSMVLSMVPMAFAATFSDVPDGKWYSENVAYVYDNGLMNGVGDGKFDPNGTLTRGMLVTVLYRIEGEPIPPDTSFTDVAAGKYYYSAVAWAENKGIVNGRTETTFAPNAPITRQEVATILMRYTEVFGYGGGESADLGEFGDAADVAGWAENAMSWAVATGLLNGSNGKLDPKGNATRAQIAAILNRFCENIMGDFFKSEKDRAMEAYAEQAAAYQSEHGGDCRFYLIYIDTDQIPEMVCAYGCRPFDQPSVYTWYNGEVRHLGEYGMLGTLPYAPYQNAFGDYSKPMKIVEGYAYEADFDTDNFIEIYYDNMHKINQKNIDTILLGK